MDVHEHPGVKCWHRLPGIYVAQDAAANISALLIFVLPSAKGL